MTTPSILPSFFLTLAFGFLSASPAGAVTARIDSSGCHKIFLKNGTTLVVAVERITHIRVIYRKCGAPDRPLQYVDNARIDSILDPAGQNIFQQTDQPENGAIEPNALRAAIALGGTLLVTVVPFGFILAPLLAGAALGLGITSLKRFKKSPGKFRGKTLAWIGLIGGAVVLSLFVFSIFLLLSFLSG